MEPVLIIILPGILGGICLAWLFSRIGTRQWGPSSYEHLEPPSTNVINMARIRVSGVGGLGMVAMSIVVAAFVPRIRLSMAVAFALGASLAVIMIARRRRTGPLAPDNPPGAHTMLPLEPTQKDVQVPAFAGGTPNDRSGQQDQKAFGADFFQDLHVIKNMADDDGGSVVQIHRASSIATWRLPATTGRTTSTLRRSTSCRGRAPIAATPTSSAPSSTIGS